MKEKKIVSAYIYVRITRGVEKQNKKNILIREGFEVREEYLSKYFYVVFIIYYTYIHRHLDRFGYVISSDVIASSRFTSPRTKLNPFSTSRTTQKTVQYHGDFFIFIFFHHSP